MLRASTPRPPARRGPMLRSPPTHRRSSRRYGPNGTLWAEHPEVPALPIRSWQIWNEPNLGPYWCGKPNAKQYVAMLRAVGTAIKQVDRGAQIVTAGLPDSKLGYATPLKRFIDQMYAAKAAKYFDSLAINSYAKDERDLGRLLGGIRKQMNAHRDRGGQIWITEIGWGDRGPKHRFIVGEKGQADRIAKSFALIRKQRTKLRLRGVVYFSWRDGAPVRARLPRPVGPPHRTARHQWQPEVRLRRLREAVEDSPLSLNSPKWAGAVPATTPPAWAFRFTRSRVRSTKSGAAT